MPISLRYIRTGSSIPIMSADSASSSSRVGSSTASAVSFAGASMPSGTLTPSTASSSTISTVSWAAAGLRVLVGGEIEVLVVVIVEVGVRVGGHGSGRGARTPGPHRRELRFLELALGPARARREHGLDELLVQGIGHVRGSSEGSGA